MLPVEQQGYLIRIRLKYLVPQGHAYARNLLEQPAARSDGRNNGNVALPGCEPPTSCLRGKRFTTWAPLGIAKRTLKTQNVLTLSSTV